MKKSIIALAVAASTMASVAQADGTTLYGSARFHYTYSDNADITYIANDVTGNSRAWGLGTGNSASTAGNNSSRFGIRGTNDLGNGLTAGYKFEVGIGGGNINNRDAFANLSGAFGTVQIGRFTLPYDGVVGYTDIFNGVGGGYAVRDIRSQTSNVVNTQIGADPWGWPVFATTNQSPVPGVPGRVSNVLAYVSPNFNGFSFTAGVVADGVGGIAHDHSDAYQVTASYDNNGIHAAIGYLDVRDTMDALAVSLGYENDQFMVGFSAEKTGYDAAPNWDPVYYNLAAKYNINEANSIYASAGVYDHDLVGVSNSVAYGIGYQHNFNKTTRVWAEYEHMDTGTPDSAPGVKADRNTISLGLRTDF